MRRRRGDAGCRGGGNTTPGKRMQIAGGPLIRRSGCPAANAKAVPEEDARSVGTKANDAGKRKARTRKKRAARACGDYVPLIYGPPPPSLWQSFLCADTTRAAAMRNRHKLASCARLEVFGNEVPQRRATADVNHVSKPRARSPPYKQEKRQLRGARRFVVSQ